MLPGSHIARASSAPCEPDPPRNVVPKNFNTHPVDIQHIEIISVSGRARIDDTGDAVPLILSRDGLVSSHDHEARE